MQKIFLVGLITISSFSFYAQAMSKKQIKHQLPIELQALTLQQIINDRIAKRQLNRLKSDIKKFIKVLPRGKKQYYTLLLNEGVLKNTLNLLARINHNQPQSDFPISQYEIQKILFNNDFTVLDTLEPKAKSSLEKQLISTQQAKKLGHQLITYITMALESDPEEVKKLIRSGAALNEHYDLTDPVLIAAVKKMGIPPRHQTEITQIVNILLKAGVDPQAKDHNNKTALDWANRFNYRHIQKILNTYSKK